MGIKEEAEIANHLIELAEILKSMDDSDSRVASAKSVFIKLTKLIEQELKMSLLPYRDWH